MNERQGTLFNFGVKNVVSCAIPVENVIVDIVPGGMKLELQLRRGDGQAAHAIIPTSIV
jgi:hypothetical protein